MRIRIGKGEVVSQIGEAGGIPCVIIEPVTEAEYGVVGQPGPERLNSGDIVAGGLALEIHSAEGALVLIDTISQAALRIGIPKDANRSQTV